MSYRILNSRTAAWHGLHRAKLRRWRHAARPVPRGPAGARHAVGDEEGAGAVSPTGQAFGSRPASHGAVEAMTASTLERVYSLAMQIADEAARNMIASGGSWCSLWSRNHDLHNRQQRDSRRRRSPRRSIHALKSQEQS